MRTIEVQYKSHLIESDVEDIYKFFRTDTKDLSGVGKVFLRTVKSHLELYRNLKSTLPPQELHLVGSDIYQVPGKDYFLNNSTKIYKDEPIIRD